MCARAALWRPSVGSIPKCGTLTPCLAPRRWHSGRVQRRVHRNRLQRRVARSIAPSQLSELEHHLPPAVLQHLAARVRLEHGHESLHRLAEVSRPRLQLARERAAARQVEERGARLQ